MTKSIETLRDDIYGLFADKKSEWFHDELAIRLGTDISRRLQSNLGVRTSRPTLRLSQMGLRCPKALWYSLHHPELAEPIPPWAEIKYSFGHVLEALAIELAKAAGHSVVGEQDELRLDDIVGHRDCVIDGSIVDVKSASSISFNKFKQGSFTDSFGYLDQLDSYVLASANDPLVTDKRFGYILAIDKQLGHICLYKHEVTDERATILRARINTYKQIAGASVPPACNCGTIEQGQTGNIQLDLKAGYSPYKHSCFPHLRTFLYSNGPVYLTKVVKRPRNQNGPIAEIDKHGKFVYN